MFFSFDFGCDSRRGGAHVFVQTDILTLLLEHPSRPVEVEVEAQVLCEECGPRDDEDGYSITRECKGCGKVRTLNFF